MAKCLILIITLVHMFAATTLACSVGVESFPSDKPIDCRGIESYSNGPLRGEWRSPKCDRLSEKQNYDKSEIYRAALVRECLCEIVPREDIWSKLVEDNSNSITHLTIAATQTLLLNYGLAAANATEFLLKFDDMERDSRSATLKRNLLASIKYLRMSNPEDPKKFCDQIKNSFKKADEYLFSAARLMNDIRIYYNRADFNKNFFKVMVAYRSCKFIEGLKEVATAASSAFHYEITTLNPPQLEIVGLD